MSEPLASSGRMRDLLPRLLSGLVMAAAALAMTAWGVWPFAVLVLAVGLIVTWEWGHMVRKTDFDLIMAIHGLAVLAAVVLAVMGLAALSLVVLLIAAVLAALLGFDQLGRISALGVLYAGLPSVALIWFRSSGLYALASVLFLFAVVWGTDTGAYVSGRTFGGPKLMPRFSPNKTWSGLCGGVATACLLAIGFCLVVPGLKPLWLVPVAAGLAIVAQAGDLMESALKRWSGVKDASGLIPGHGGFMDRVDGMIVAVVVAAIAAAAIAPQAPARALLLGF